jgi:hypothetical protein
LHDDIRRGFECCARRRGRLIVLRRRGRREEECEAKAGQQCAACGARRARET